MVGVAGEGVTSLLGGGLLALGLEGRGNGVGGALEGVTSTLSVGLLVLGL